MAVMASCQEEPVAKVLHLCRKLCRSLSRKMPDPTKVATKAADTVFSSADFCNILWLAASCSAVLLVNIVRDDRRWLYLPTRRVMEKTMQSRAVMISLVYPCINCA